MAAFSSCSAGRSESLILYYSQTGATEKVAQELQRQTGADIERFDVEQVYDDDFTATVERVKVEREAGTLPTPVPVKSDISKYDVIYGEVDPLPEYSAPADVMTEERAIYDEATDGYPFPLGEPVSSEAGQSQVERIIFSPFLRPRPTGSPERERYSFQKGRDRKRSSRRS